MILIRIVAFDDTGKQAQLASFQVSRLLVLPLSYLCGERSEGSQTCLLPLLYVVGLASPYCMNYCT